MMTARIKMSTSSTTKVTRPSMWSRSWFISNLVGESEIDRLRRTRCSRKRFFRGGNTKPSFYEKRCSNKKTAVSFEWSCTTVSEWEQGFLNLMTWPKNFGFEGDSEICDTKLFEHKHKCTKIQNSISNNFTKLRAEFKPECSPWWYEARASIQLTFFPPDRIHSTSQKFLWQVTVNVAIYPRNSQNQWHLEQRAALPARN